MVRVQSDKRLAWIPSTAAAVAVLVLLGFVFSGPIERLDEFLYDRAVRGSQVTPPADIAVVAIDRSSIERLGSWPWPAGLHTQLIRKLQAAGAPLVAYTVPVGQPANASGLEQLRAAIELLESAEVGKSSGGEQLRKMLGDSMADLDQVASLAEAIRSHANVILPVELEIASTTQAAPAAVAQSLPEATHVTVSPETLASSISASTARGPSAQLNNAARALGHTAVSPGASTIRADQAVVALGTGGLPSLALAIVAANQNLDNTSITVTDAAVASVGRYTVQLDDTLSWRPGFFSGPETAIPEFPFWQVLSGEVAAEQLRGKTVLIGLTDASVDGARLSTPLGTDFVLVRFVAGAVASLKLGQSFRHPAWADIVELLLCVAVVAFAFRLLPTLSGMSATAIALLSGAALLVVEVAVLAISHAWIHLALPAVMLFGAGLGAGATFLIKRLGNQRGRETDAVESLRMLGLTFQGQGQLDLAYETFRRCPQDSQTLELLYGIGQDFERRRQFAKAAEVYAHVASIEAGFKDVAQRRDRMRRADLVQAPGRSSAATPGKDKGEPPTIPLPQQIGTKGRQSLGRYEIERELGKGAMGVVYLGRDPKINRVVAIKAIALAEEFAEEDLADARARFFREAEMAGRLNHPGIVTVYDAGEDRGLAFIAMELLRGEHLSHYAEPIYLLPVTRVLALCSRVADALDYAHKQNVVHRDIKPANIMFNKDTDELKITDFGIARLTDTSRTKTGIVLGTPSFMSPEQLEGRPLDGRSDLFALGITLYQLLTGQLPFRADSMTRLMQKIATEQHVPLRSLRPELPEMAEQITARALAKSTADRYQTGAEFAAALRTCVRLATRKEAVAR